MKIIRKNLLALLKDASRYADCRYKGADCQITGITDDTRKVEQGNIFVCIKGKNFDGHEAAEEALMKGAAVVICDHDLKLGTRQVLVPDTKFFYGYLTAAWFDHPEQKLILVGVTGTNGKTTMTTMIHHIITHAGGKCGLIGTAGTLIGTTPIQRDDSTPTTPKVFELYGIFREMVDQGCHYCVMEVSSFALEQNRIGPAIFTCGVFTNLTRDHLDYHETMENYYFAKKKLFEHRCKIAFVNTEDDYGDRLYREITCAKYSYGLNGNTSVYASFVKFDEGVTRFRFTIPGKSVGFTLRMMGSYNVSNAIAAIAVCLKLNVPMDNIVKAMAEFPGVRGRCELIPTNSNFLIVCDYAHSPDALENMLPAIKENTRGRLICLFGCGGDRDRTKRPLMAKAAAAFSDELIITSDNPRNEDPDAIIDEIVAGLEGTDIPYERITDRKKAIFHAVRNAKKGDTIVLAGKGHEDYQVLADGVHIHFDEREICAEALAEINKKDTVDEKANLISGMSVDEICGATNGRRENISPAVRLVNATGISSDTRTITPGCVFIAFKGANFDGHNYVQAAIEKGAIAAVTEHVVPGCPCIVVESTAKAILDIAAHYRSRFTPKLVGITGSVGKTTTKEMTALAISSCFNALKTEGNHNNEIGMPFTLLQLTPEHKAAVIEMGMSHFGEIERLSKTCRPTIAMITNIGWSHAENLGSQEGILKAKLEILKGASPDAPLIINGDDRLLAPLEKTITDRKVISCGIDNKSCTYTAENISTGKSGVRFDIVHEGVREQTILLPCIGRHHVLDALFAYAAAILAGCDGAKAAEALSSFKAEGLRQHIEYRKNQTLLVDCYNAAPNSMKAAIDVLCELTPEYDGKRAAVLGDMLELGEDSTKLHYEVGQYAAEKGIGLLICVGDNAVSIAEGGKSKGARALTAPDIGAAAELLKENLSDGDVVLYKASRGVHLEDLIKTYYDNDENE